MGWGSESSIWEKLFPDQDPEVKKSTGFRSASLFTIIHKSDSHSCGQEWVMASLESGDWVDEEPYEMTDFSPAVKALR